ncbi:MAG: glycolate oxidase subunit GlcE, partial [Oricola sp.]|nr:glycolate oxidase subunit GlcE [Oricola sp.]
TVRATSESDVVEAVRDAAARGEPVRLEGGGSKSAIGRPVDGAVLSLKGLAGVVDYQPTELVVKVRPGAPLAELEALLASERQMLAFEPFDHGPLFGEAAGRATIGGVVAAGVAGSRRISAGSARDHVLGVRGVSGRGELFVAGGNVIKNVTGYDLPKLMAGSWGRLAALTELTLKVTPLPEASSTFAIYGLDPERAVAAMARALGSAASVDAAAHLPGETAATVFRLSGFEPSISERAQILRNAVELFGTLEPSAHDVWRDISALKALPPDGPLWRISIPAREGGKVALALDKLGARWLLDWGGGLAWASSDAPAETIRKIASGAGGQAMLVRAPEEMRALVPAFHRAEQGLSSLEARVRRAFDPQGVFETGRF